MRQVRLADRLRYTFDNSMSRGPIGLIGWLFLLSVILIVVVSLVVALTPIGLLDDGSRLSFVQVAWMSMMRTLDAGTMGGDTGSWPFLISMFVVTLGGVFVVSTLIGVLTSTIEGKIEDLRKGRSLIIESGHTVILGWSPQIFSIISELVIANANQKRACIAILAEKDKVEMEDELRDKIGKTGATRIVCRTGSPIDLGDLEIVSPHTSRAIIVLAPEGAEADSYTIKSILALTNNPGRRAEPYHIVAEVRDPKNLEAARLVGRNEAQLVLIGDLIARITAQSCRQSGLSIIYTELLDFGGDEIYFKEEPALVGRSYGEALFAYEDSALIGLRLADGRVQLNPPMETRIAAGDKVIAISEDDDTVRLSSLSDYGIESSALCLSRRQEKSAERTLILGWNQRAPVIINELDHYVAPGSTLRIVADSAVDEADIVEQCAGVCNQQLHFQRGDTTDRRTLDGLEIPGYHHVIVLADSDRLGVQEADAHTLITLLHLRDIADRAGHPFSIVSEMLDVRNRELAEVTHADDFIVSDRLVSLMLSQIAENKELAPVFQDLFDPEGVEIYLKPASDYVQLGRPLNFYSVVEAARRCGETAIGYRLRSQAGDPARSYGVAVNPNKSEQVTFAEADRIIVLAEQ